MAKLIRQQQGGEKAITVHVIRQFSSIKSLDRSEGAGRGVEGGMRDKSAEILFQSFLHKVIVSSSGIGRNVHS